jgi:hypothetical protein
MRDGYERGTCVYKAGLLQLAFSIRIIEWESIMIDISRELAAWDCLGLRMVVYVSGMASAKTHKDTVWDHAINH